MRAGTHNGLCNARIHKKPCTNIILTLHVRKNKWLNMGKATLLTNNDVLTLATLRAAQLVFMARRFYEHIEEHWFVGTIVGSNK